LQSLIFQRQGKNIIAKIIGINLEPLDTGNGKQVVFFCEDSGGKRYRVPKSEVIAKGVLKSANKSSGQSAKTKRKNKRANRKTTA
jgi:hypothetical protein